MMMVRAFPLLALSLSAYALLDWISPVTDAVPWYDHEAFAISLVSLETWRVTMGQLFVLVSMIFLFVETLRSTRVIVSSNINHALSSLISGVAVVLFVTRPGYGNFWFFIFVVIATFDFLAGFIITTASARRDIEIERFGHAR